MTLLPNSGSAGGKASRIFEGYKALGIVTNDVPVLVRYVQKLKDIRIITCTGRYFHSYNSKLQLVETSHAHPSQINAMASDTYNVYTASANEIFVWRQGHKWLIGTFAGHEHTVTVLLPFGPHLLSVDESSIVKVWELAKREVVLEIPFDNKSFRVSTACHPTTYINKILFGSCQGSLQLWNIRKQKLIYTFKGWASPVRCIEQSPAIGVVSIGLEDGRIFLHNLKDDETLMNFRQEWGAVLSLSFRTDDPEKCAHLVSTSPLGHIAIWDLDKCRLKAQMRNVHDGPVTCAKFYEKEPLLITSSPDNSLKVWCFDETDGTGRRLYERDGHSLPPSRIRFHGRKGHFILSAGLDSRLKSFSTLTERLNRNLGKASYSRKHAKKVGSRHDPNVMQPIAEFTTDLTREKEWDNIAACHRETNVVTTWSFDKMKMGEHKLLHDRFRNKSNVVAKCVTLSACGNFVIIGYSTGHVDKFNIQSGVYRGSFGKDGMAHDGPVQSIVSDILNQLVVTAGLDRKLKFWRFKTGQLLTELCFDSSICQTVLHRDNYLLAFATDDYGLYVLDLETRKIIREFESLGSTITDFTFSPDSKWLIAATIDCSIRVWDLVLGELIDHFLVASPCVSLTMSPSGEFLATAHVQDLGIYLWSNVSLYAVLSLKTVPKDYEPKLLDLPQVKIDQLDGNEDGVEQPLDEHKAVKDDEEMDADGLEESPDEAQEMIILSSLRSSRWKNLLHLDTIKKRNKPKEPLEKPKVAPFFIPVLSGLQPKLGASGDTNEPECQTKLNRLPFFSMSEFSNTLIDCHRSCNYVQIWKKLKQLGPSAIDVEVRLLDTQVPDSDEQHLLLTAFMSAVEQAMSLRSDFEFVQACFALFLKIHSDIILKNPALNERCEVLENLVEREWDRLRLLFTENFSIINYLKSVIL